MTMNCDVIATIQSVFMNITTGSISEMVDDSFDPDTLEFAVTAFTNGCVLRPLIMNWLLENRTSVM